jgi:hypothetical protein
MNNEEPRPSVEEAGLWAVGSSPSVAALVPSEPTTCDLSGTERLDGYDIDQQLARRMQHWLDDLVLAGALTVEDQRRIHIAVGLGRWEWTSTEKAVRAALQ